MDTTVIVAVIGLQSFWIACSLRNLGKSIDVFRVETARGFAVVDQRFDAVDKRFENVQADVRELRGDIARVNDRVDRL